MTSRLLEQAPFSSGRQVALSRPDAILAGPHPRNGGDPWLFILSASLLRALHGLEPGHSKTMMAAFIIAIRGTVAQAVLLGIGNDLPYRSLLPRIAT